MPQQRHSAFETWQADVMRTIVDGGPLATSYFASTERHHESMRAVARNRVRGDSGPLLGSTRQRGERAVVAIAVRFRAMRLAVGQRQALAPPAPAQETYPRVR